MVDYILLSVMQLISEWRRIKMNEKLEMRYRIAVLEFLLLVSAVLITVLAMALFLSPTC